MTTYATTDPPANWRPTAEQQKHRRLAGFMQWMSEHRGIAPADFRQAWRWWVEDVSEFWGAVREYFSVTGTRFNGSAFAVERMPGAISYPNARMNLTENMLRKTSLTNQPTKDKMPIDQAYAKPRTMRRTAALAAIAVAALAGAWARRDYLAWLALGEGGLPANPKGWLITSYLRLRKADPIATAVYDAQIHTPGAAAHLGPLPGRRGPRPRIAAWPIPHRQLDQFPGPEMRTALERVFDDALRTHAGPVHSKLSHFEKRNSAVTLRDPVAGHPDARLSEGETAHIHPYDGSMHMIFSAADATSVLDAGWGERHPLAGVLPELPSTYIYVYPPRDGAELAIVAQLLNAAIEHMTSTGTDQSGDRQHRPPKAPTTPRRTHMRGAPPPTPGQRHE